MADDTKLVGQIEKSLLLMASKQHGHQQTGVPLVQSPLGTAGMGPYGCLHTQLIALQEKNSKFRKPKHFLIGDKQACLSAPDGYSTSSSKYLFYANILVRIPQNKRQIVPHSKTCRNVRDPWRSVSQEKKS